MDGKIHRTKKAMMPLSPVAITLGVLVAAILLFMSGRLRPDLIALLVALSLGLSSVLTPQETFSGFSRSAIFTILGIFILAEGLRCTGVTEQIGNFLLRMADTKESRLASLSMISSAFLSLFMNNIAAASVVLPGVSSAARRANASLSRLLMPLAFGTILGGMATLFTTANIIVSSLLRDHGLQGFGVFAFAPVGLPLIAIGVIFMLVWGRRLLPEKSPKQRLLDQRQQQAKLLETYRLGERLIWARVPANSNLVDVPLGQSQLREKYNLNVVAIKRQTKMIPSPLPGLTFKPGDVILLEGKQESTNFESFASDLEILGKKEGKDLQLPSPNSIIIEAVLAPRSTLIGQTLRSAHFREKYRLNVIAIWRANLPIRTGLSDLGLQFGDALLLQGSVESINMLRMEPDIIVLAEESLPVPAWSSKAWLAVGIMALTLGIAVVNPSLIGEVMLAGAVTMILVGILTMDQAYSAIDLKTVVLVGGMLPLGIAMTKTGVAAGLGNALITFLGHSNPLLILAGFIALTALLTQVMNGPVVAAVMAPIAIETAQSIGTDPRSMAMGVALAASMAFITPLGHPVNTLVMGPGGYTFRDFVKVGLPLTLLLFLAIMVLLPIFWPLK